MRGDDMNKRETLIVRLPSNISPETFQEEVKRLERDLKPYLKEYFDQILFLSNDLEFEILRKGSIFRSCSKNSEDIQRIKEALIHIENALNERNSFEGVGILNVIITFLLFSLIEIFLIFSLR